jgi:hypothetical protein
MIEFCGLLDRKPKCFAFELYFYLGLTIGALVYFDCIFYCYGSI